MTRAKRAKPKAVRPEFQYMLAFWNGRLAEIAMALDRARLGPLPPKVNEEIAEAFYALNRAQVYLHEYERTVTASPRTWKKKGKR